MGAAMSVSVMGRTAWKVGKRWLWFVHRWLGIAVCLLFVL